MEEAFISSNQAGSVFASGNINLVGDPMTPDPAIIFALDGALTVTAGDDINFIDNSLIQNANGVLSVIAGNDINMSPTSSITNASGHDINIVVDNDLLSPPEIGTGSLNMPVGATVNGSGRIMIYTARQELNTIQGLIAGTPFVSGLLFADTPPEKWLSYFQNTSFYHSSQPFTVYYKDGVLSGSAIERSQVLVGEMLTDLHPYDEYLGWFLEFHAAYDMEGYEKHNHKGTSSFQVNADQLYYLRMKKNFDHNPRINNMILFPKNLEIEKL